MALQLLRLSPDNTKAVVAHKDHGGNDGLFLYRGLGSDLVTYSACAPTAHQEWTYVPRSFDTFADLVSWLDSDLARVAVA